MGYYTNYEITTDKVLPDDFEDKFEEITDYAFGYGEFGAKWYDYKADMKEISKIYPDILFTVEGEGEESGDIWRHYFKNGEDYRVEPVVIWPEFNEKNILSDKKYI